MKTYQDLLECGNDEQKRMDFIRAAIQQHKTSEFGKKAEKSTKYYGGENPTITEYEKVVFDLQGKAYKDMFTANHKIKSAFFQFVVDQEVNYLLGNGVTFKKEDTKKKLGTKKKPFDQQAYRTCLNGVICGKSFGFWNNDHIDVFKGTEFVPLYDEENGALMAGVRFWQIDNSKPLRATLYEIDGYTEYIQRKGEDMTIINHKRNYRLNVRRSDADGTVIYGGQNYPTFPIVPFKNNEEGKSEICGKQNTIDAIDLARSNMVNNIDEGNLLYWVLSNCGGMDDLDDVKFLERLKLTHVAHTDGDPNTTITPHTVEAPFEGTSVTIDMLQKALFQDFQAFDSDAVSAGNQTATAIKASYVPLDLKVDKLENQVTEFINGILELAGIDDEPSYTRNKIVNQTEETQMVLSGSEYVDDEYITRKLLTIWGDADMADEILKRKAADDLGRFGNQEAEEDVPDENEVVETAEEVAGKTLNGSKTASLITVIRQLSSGAISEGQAVKILTTAIGVTREEALSIIRGEE